MLTNADLAHACKSAIIGVNCLKEYADEFRCEYRLSNFFLNHLTLLQQFIEKIEVNSTKGSELLTARLTDDMLPLNVQTKIAASSPKQPIILINLRGLY